MKTRRRQAAATASRYPPLSCGTLAANLRTQGATWPWRLRVVGTCASTESLLQRWAPRRSHGPFAVVARRQRHGRGQWGRPWSAPPGGVWLSAAWPLPRSAAAPLQTGGLGLAVAVAVMEWLERLGLTVAFKWPNDILLEQRKLAGLLTRRQLRGGVTQQLGLGLGLNVANAVPAGAVALWQRLGTRTPSLPQAQAAVLLACERAMVLLERPAALIQACQTRLWRPRDPLAGPTGAPVRVVGLTPTGSLRLRRQDGRTEVAHSGTWRLPAPRPACFSSGNNGATGSPGEIHGPYAGWRPKPQNLG